MGHACLQKLIEHQTKAYKTIATQLLSVNDFVFYVFHKMNDHLSEATAAASRQPNANTQKEETEKIFVRSIFFVFLLFCFHISKALNGRRCIVTMDSVKHESNSNASGDL